MNAHTPKISRHRRQLVPLVGLLLTLLTPPAFGAASSIDISCTDDLDGTTNFLLPVKDGETGQWEPALGMYAAPEATPTQLVVIGHGSTHTIESWRSHAEKLAREHGFLVVAMEYRGLNRLDDEFDEDEGHDPKNYWHDYDGDRKLPKSGGWPVRKGGEDLNEATRQFQIACPSIGETVLMGVSMGATMTGWALTHDPRRADRTPLYDYWLAVEGVHNMTESYLEAKAIGHADAGHIEAETGAISVSDQEFAGRSVSFPHPPEAYTERTNVMQADKILAAGLDRAIYIHAVYDGLVGYWQSRSMASVLRDVPTEFYTVTRREVGDDGTVLEDHVLDRGPEELDFEAPLAGHGKESNEEHIIIRAAFARLAELANNVDTQCGEYHSYDENEQLQTDAVPGRTYSCNEGAPPPAEPTGGGKVKGSGWLDTGNRKINFSFKAESDADATGFKGKLKYRDKDRGLKIRVDEITAIGALTNSCGSIEPGPNAIEFHGNGTFNDEPASFRVCAEDNGKGSKAPADRFALSCIAGCNYHSFARATGKLGGGNIKLYRAPNGTDSGQQSSDATAPAVLFVDPLLDDALTLGSLHQFEVRAVNGRGDASANTTVEFRQELSDGTSYSISVATDANGFANIPVYITPGTVRYFAVAGELTSNQVEVESIIP